MPKRKYAATQKGNPRKLTINQHVFPAASLKRFSDPATNLLEVRRHLGAAVFKVKPRDEIFCAKRSWDQRAESVLMRSIEKPFQGIAEEIVRGRRALGKAEFDAISQFSELWRLRSAQKASPPQDVQWHGISPEQLTLDQQENLEKNHYIFVDSNGKFPGRMVAGLTIQVSLISFPRRFPHLTWGILESTDGEFIVPDQFGQLLAVPLTPTLCLMANWDNILIKRHHVAELNRRAISVANDHYSARNFASCPLL